MVTITLKGREIPLAYTTYEMMLIQRDIAPISRAVKLALGKNPDDDEDLSLFGGADHLKAVAALIRILGNAGLEEAGETADLTDKRILRAMKPNELIMAISKCMDAMNEGMASEIPPKEEEGPVDVTLEEMKKKETRES